MGEADSTESVESRCELNNGLADSVLLLEKSRKTG